MRKRILKMCNLISSINLQSNIFALECIWGTRIKVFAFSFRAFKNTWIYPLKHCQRDPPFEWPSLHFSTDQAGKTGCSMQESLFWLAEQTKPTHLKQLTSNAICWGLECCTETWEPFSVSPRQQASAPGRAASPLAHAAFGARKSPIHQL